MRKTRKNNHNPNPERNATTPLRSEVAALAKVDPAKRLTKSKTQLNRRSVVSLHAAVVAAIREIDHQADGEPDD